MIYDLIVIGGGPAGLAAAISAYESGLKHVLILERDKEAGGILNQCIHNGFGLHYFKEELTGPEYAAKFTQMLNNTDIELELDTMVLHFDEGENGEKRVHAVSKSKGYRVISSKTVVLAMGCRERTRGAISIPGTRPAGVFTAGTAQRYVNMEGYMVGKRVVILGSGDIGLIMARRMTLEGAQVLACVEVMPYSGGLNRNIVQCLNDYDIPLYLSHTITNIEGDERVRRVTIAKVGDDRKPVEGTQFDIECDTVLLSVGLIPENELAQSAGIEIDTRTKGAVVFENMQTSMPGVFACGNALHVHDLVDFVTQESMLAGSSAAAYVAACGSGTLANKNGEPAPSAKIENGTLILLRPGTGVGYTVPQKIRLNNVEKSVKVYFRVRNIFKNAKIKVFSGDREIAAYSREHMAPGEMENITLPKTLLEKVESELPLVINVEN